jgi:cysteine desulfurase/selenocysteine lyase
VRAGDEIIVSEMEHHSNIVPWQLLCAERGASLRVIPVDDCGHLLLEELDRLLTDKTRLVSVAHVSNVLGTVNPVAEIVRRAHRRGVPVLVDGAQAVPHLEVDVRALDCDFYAFSGHKVYGPTGIGVLHGKGAFLDSLPPYQGGGDMIQNVTFEAPSFQKPPYRFEAGTPNASGATGLAAALTYLSGLGRRQAFAHEQDLLRRATEAISEFPRVSILGQAREKASVLSLAIDGVDPHAAAALLDQRGIAVRAGHLCAQPLMRRLGLEACLRASFALYNTREEVDAFAGGIRRAIRTLG